MCRTKLKKWLHEVNMGRLTFHYPFHKNFPPDCRTMSNILSFNGADDIVSRQYWKRRNSFSSANQLILNGAEKWAFEGRKYDIKCGQKWAIIAFICSRWHLSPVIGSLNYFQVLKLRASLTDTHFATCGTCVSFQWVCWLAPIWGSAAFLITRDGRDTLNDTRGFCHIFVLLRVFLLRNGRWNSIEVFCSLYHPINGTTVTIVDGLQWHIWRLTINVMGMNSYKFFSSKLSGSIFLCSWFLRLEEEYWFSICLFFVFFCRK